LQRFGTVVRYTGNRNLLVLLEAREKPSIGSEVMGTKLQVVGRVADVLGPVSRPYALVKPSVENPEKYIGQHVYAERKMASRRM
jgi:RNA-binding protein